jgi:hypothetical protein
MFVIVQVRMIMMIVRIGMTVGGIGFLSIDEYTSFARGDAAAVDGIKDERCAEVECRGGLIKKRWRDTGVNESAEQHVTAEAGKAFEIADTHGYFL